MVTRYRSRFVLLCLALSATGCDKIKAAMGKGGDVDGGAAAASGGGSGGGILSMLGSDFEGTIAANIKSKTQSAPMQVTFAIKKPKFRLEIPNPPTPNPAMAGGGSVIIDPPSKKGWVLVPAQKMAIELDFEKMKSGRSGIPGLPAAAKAPTTPPKIDKTGKKDTVAGYTCEVWNVTSDNKKAEVCVAEGITWFDLTELGMASPELALAAVATDANRFPLRVVAYDAAGAEETRMEATKIVKAKLGDAQFVVPADYKSVDMSAMMAGLGGMPSGGFPGRPGGPPGLHPVPPVPPNGRPLPPKAKH